MNINFNEFLDRAWANHATHSSEVAAQIADGIKLISQGDQISQMAHLVTHVFGEHLGRWDDGIGALKQLRQVQSYESDSENEKAISRSIASLELAGGKRTSVSDLSKSDQIRVLAVAASALTERKNAREGQELFRKALEIAQTGLPKEDPANRALAVAGNNLACALEEKSARSSVETELMMLAAQTGRNYWETAGDWLQIERAEYRLSKTFLNAGDLIFAVEHAQACLEIVEENDASVLEFFFGYEALASAEKARENIIGFSKAAEQAKFYFDQLSVDDKSWCEASLYSLSR